MTIRIIVAQQRIIVQDRLSLQSQLFHLPTPNMTSALTPAQATLMLMGLLPTSVNSTSPQPVQAVRSPVLSVPTPSLTKPVSGP